MTELFDTPWVVNATTDPAYRAYALATQQRDDRPALLGPTIHTIDEFLEAVLSEEAIGLAPASAARYYPRPGVSYVPVPDAEPSVCTLSWHADRDLAPAAQALVELVRSRLPAAPLVALTDFTGNHRPSGAPDASITPCQRWQATQQRHSTSPPPTAPRNRQPRGSRSGCGSRTGKRLSGTARGGDPHPSPTPGAIPRLAPAPRATRTPPR